MTTTGTIMTRPTGVEEFMARNGNYEGPRGTWKMSTGVSTNQTRAPKTLATGKAEVVSNKPHLNDKKKQLAVPTATVVFLAGRGVTCAAGVKRQRRW